MDKPEPVKSKPRHIYIMYEMLTFEHKLIVWVPVSTYSQNFGGTPLYSNDIGFSDFIVRIIKTFYDNISVYLIHCISVVIRYRITIFFCLTFLYICMERPRVSNICIPVEPVGLQFLQIVFGLTHDMRNTFRALYMRCPIRNNHIFGGNINCRLSSYVRIEIHLLKGGTRKPQTV